jgi:chromate transporter
MIYLTLFLEFFKMGLFTFGGGYAMVVVLENEMVEKKGWIEQEEFYNLLAIAESTPGPIAINSSTYIGYKVGGILGSILATLGVVLPSFIIIYLISLFFDAFLSLTLVAYAFKGIQMAVCYLIFSAGVKMVKKLKKNLFNLVLFSLTFVVFITLTLLSIKFSSIFYILIGGISSLTIFSISTIVSRNKGGAR